MTENDKRAISAPLEPAAPATWQDKVILWALAVAILIMPAAWGGLFPDLPNYPLYLLFAVIVLGKLFYLTHYLAFLVAAGLNVPRLRGWQLFCFIWGAIVFGIMKWSESLNGESYNSNDSTVVVIVALAPYLIGRFLKLVLAA